MVGHFFIPLFVGAFWLHVPPRYAGSEAQTIGKCWLREGALDFVGRLLPDECPCGQPSTCPSSKSGLCSFTKASVSCSPRRLIRSIHSSDIAEKSVG